jgi:choice-of-anchor C domain-containing protein
MGRKTPPNVRRRALTSVGTLAAVATLGLWSATPAAAAGPFANGDFESPVAPNGQEVGEGQATRIIGPWQVSGGNVDLVPASYWQAASGNQSLDLNGNQSGTIEQIFSTVPGTTYTVTYALAGNPDGPPTLKTGRVLIDGADAHDFAFNVFGHTRGSMGYVTQSFVFRATLPQTTLTFESTHPGDFGPVIDNVTITS